MPRYRVYRWQKSKQTDRWLPVVARTHTCAFESRDSSTITCATSSPLFHCKLLEPRAELYSYHNEKVVPIRNVETHEWFRRAIAIRECDSNSSYKSRTNKMCETRIKSTFKPRCMAVHWNCLIFFPTFLFLFSIHHLPIFESIYHFSIDPHIFLSLKAGIRGQIRSQLRDCESMESRV